MHINNFNLDIYEKCVKNKKNLYDPIIIFNINDKSDPIYIDNKNIIDFKKYNNENTVFFI